MKKAERENLPKFNSLEEEREYWEARGPLAPGNKGKFVEKRKTPNRSCSLAIRLSGIELTELRDLAGSLGIGPSTFARLAVLTAIKNSRHAPVNQSKEAQLSQFKNAFSGDTISHIMNELAYKPDSVDRETVDKIGTLFLGFLESLRERSQGYQRITHPAAATRDLIYSNQWIAKGISQSNCLFKG